MDESRRRGRRSVRFTRPAVVTAMMLFGLTLLGLAWFGVSGKVRVDQQISWVVGAAVPGLFFVVLGGITLGARVLRSFGTGVAGVADHVDDLHRRIVDQRFGGSGPRPGLAGAVRADPVLVPAGASSYHRSGCIVLGGKPDPTPVARADLAGRSLVPCRLCEPDGAQTAS